MLVSIVPSGRIGAASLPAQAALGNILKVSAGKAPPAMVSQQRLAFSGGPTCTRTVRIVAAAPSHPVNRKRHEADVFAPPRMGAGSLRPCDHTRCSERTPVAPGVDRRSLRPQFLQQRLRLLQITRVKPFAEPAVNRSQQYFPPSQ
jgi:hypothetical protein